MPAVEIETLSQRFDRVEALSGVSLTINEGERFGLLGPNGAGKTTLLSVLATLLRPSAGRVRMFGRDVLGEVAAVRRLVGLVPQDVSLYPALTARENLAFFGRLYGLSNRDLRRRIAEVLAIVGLQARADEPVAGYSGGMKRRLNLAAGLVHAPRLLLLDEPTVGVDPQSRQRILDAILGIAAAGTSVIYTTHYMEEAERVCERIAIMDQGRILTVGTLRQLLTASGIDELIEIAWQPNADERERLLAVAEITGIDSGPETTLIRVSNAGRALAPIVALATESVGAVRGLVVHPANLERVFMRLTGKALRD